MTRQLYWNPSTLILPQGSGLVRLFQAHDRRNVLGNQSVLALADALVGGRPEAQVRDLYTSAAPPIQLVDATAFSLWDHAHGNPDFLDRTLGAADLQALDWEEGSELLLDARIITDVWPPPADYDKRHYGDRFRGSFFEQLATESLFQRTTPTAWWTAQKFEADHLHTRPTPYRYIEEQFLDGYFRDHFRGQRVLEIGCGTGYFTARIARQASQAIGVDYNRDYVDIARQRWPASEYPNLQFRVCDIIDLPRQREEWLGEPFDAVILIDTFLFLFDQRYQAALYERRRDVLSNVKALLKPQGLLLVLDPHPLWLTPWLGSPDNPIGILTEYRQRRFKVIPTLEELTGLLFENGLRLRRVLEPDVAEEYRTVDRQAYHFFREVPQWWFLEMEAAA